MVSFDQCANIELKQNFIDNNMIDFDQIQNQQVDEEQLQTRPSDEYGNDI
jgi:hypothetical protein